jgi:hypothetical protein
LAGHHLKGNTMQTNTQATTMRELFGEPISVYTRAQAIEDGALIDVSTTAREAGTVWPVAITGAAWADCVEWTDETEKRKGYTGQSESGRLWDVCWMLSVALRRAARQGQTAGPSHPLAVGLLRTPREGRGVKPHLVHLKCVIGPGGNGRPCITLMMQGED